MTEQKTCDCGNRNSEFEGSCAECAESRPASDAAAPAERPQTICGCGDHTFNTSGKCDVCEMMADREQQQRSWLPPETSEATTLRAPAERTYKPFEKAWEASERENQALRADVSRLQAELDAAHAASTILLNQHQEALEELHAARASLTCDRCHVRRDWLQTWTLTRCYCGGTFRTETA